MSCRTLTTQHGKHGAIIQHDVVAPTPGGHKAQQCLHFDTVLVDGVLQIILAFLQRTLSLRIDQ